MQVPHQKEYIQCRTMEPAPDSAQARMRSVQHSRSLKTAANRRVTNSMILWHFERLAQQQVEPHWALILSFITPASHQIIHSEIRSESGEGRYITMAGNIALRGYLYWLRAVERTVTHYLPCIIVKKDAHLHARKRSRRSGSDYSDDSDADPEAKISSIGAVRCVRLLTQMSTTSICTEA